MYNNITWVNWCEKETTYAGILNLLLKIQEAVEHFSYDPEIAYDYEYRNIKEKLDIAIEAAKLCNTVVLKESVSDIVTLLTSISRDHAVTSRTFIPLAKKLDEEYILHI